MSKRDLHEDVQADLEAMDFLGVGVVLVSHRHSLHLRD